MDSRRLSCVYCGIPQFRKSAMVKNSSCGRGRSIGCNRAPSSFHLRKRAFIDYGPESLKIALVAPPLIAVPPVDYGGTELFVAQLAEGLARAGMDVTVYANGESTVNVKRRWIYQTSQWPIKVPERARLRELNHESWAMHDAAPDCEVIHVQSAQALTFSRFLGCGIVLTLHGPHEDHLSEFFSFYPDAHYVCISEAQCAREKMPKMRTIHHGIDTSLYQISEQKQHYLSFIGRIAPLKGTHIAIEVAKRTGIPLKIAGDVQPMYREYFEKKIKPHVDGTFIEYVGLADHAAKNELLSQSKAMLFPIQWDEPFGLVMVEAMACGTPVVAMAGGSVPEVVRNGVSGYICRSVTQMAKRVTDLNLQPAAVRKYVEENFSITHMVQEYVNLYKEVASEHRSISAA